MDEKRIISYCSQLLAGLQSFARRVGGDLEGLINSAEHLSPDIRASLREALAADQPPPTGKKTLAALPSVLMNISLSEKASSSEEMYYHLPGEIGEFDQQLFPKKSGISDRKAWLNTLEPTATQFKAAWKAFRKDFKELGKEKDLRATSYSLYYLLFKHFSRVPTDDAAFADDVTLYDRNRVKAAVAICHDFDDLDKNEPFLLLKGDLSGIQKFMYSDVDMGEAGNTQKLAKKLRGRSFYVSLLTDYLADLFVRKLELLEANIIYTGGGHFVMLVPNRLDTQETLLTLQKEVNHFLRTRLAGRTHFLLGQVVCKENVLTDPSTYLQLLSADLNAQKYKKHQAYLEDIFQVQEDDYAGRERADEFQDDKRLGEKLPYASRYFMIEIGCNKELQVQGEQPDVSIQVGDDFRYFFLAKDDGNKQVDLKLDTFFSVYGQDIYEARVIALNRTDFLAHQSLTEAYWKDISIAFGFRFVGCYAPTSWTKDKKGFEIKVVQDFGQLEACNDAESEIIEEAQRLHEAEQLGFQREFDSQAVTTLDYPYLAVMRLDVDSLGKIFNFGFPENNKSLARTATLSREFYLFFSGYLNQLAEKYKIYVTYSGGDDAFVVGSWINVIHFARSLRKKFRAFACNNPDITFSAGIFLCDSHYPVAKFADKAADREEAAKEFVLKADKQVIGTKNAVSLFDHVLSWEQFDAMMEFAVKLLAYTKWGSEKTNKRLLSRALVHRILRLIKACIGRDGNTDVARLYKNTSQLHYLFAKHDFTDKLVHPDKYAAEQAHVHEITRMIAQDIVQVLLKNFQEHGTKDQIITNYLIPTHYVTLKTRTKA